ncbi:hypothetical protein ACISK3_12635 [Morganella morganii]
MIAVISALYCCPETPTGLHPGKPVVFTIAAGEMHKTGYPFYPADNGVLLTPHVPIKYLSQEKPG